MKVTDLPTPALLLDLEFLSRNAAIMDDIRKNTSMELYPHYKSHKCVELARLQMEWGAKGITCAKLSEAMDLCDAGIENIVIANQIVQQEKFGFLADLAKRCRLTVCVDHAENVMALERAMAQKDARLNLLVEYDVGMHRCGVESYEEALVLANLIKSQSHLSFEGIQAYAGHLSHEASTQVRAELGAGVETRLKEAKAYLEAHGLTVPQVSGCSTASVRDHALPDTVYTEFQPGSYLFMDAAYRPLADLPFRNSLFVLATVMSKGNGKTITDAGAKAVSTDQLPPVFLGYEEYPVELSEEHGAILIPENDKQVGDKMWLIPSHCCTCINIYDWLYFVRDGKVVNKVPVNSRGKSV